MEVYLDNSATTKPYDEAAECMARVMRESYGNPSALHLMGKAAEDRLNSDRALIAKLIGAKENEIYFTSGGTESDNLAIIGYAMANKRSGRRIICGATEHAAVLGSFKYLESLGFEAVYICVDEYGYPDMDALKNAIDDNTILLSFMYVNNETGTIFPIDEISALKKGKNCALHVDAVQAFGKLDINVKKSAIDMLSISSHKIHGPNGVGALYVRDGVKISPISHGGNQERTLRSGTENIAGIASFAKACELKFKAKDADNARMTELKARFLNKLTSALDDVVVNSPGASLCSILNLSFLGVKSEVLLHVLESKGIYVSTGSACNSKKNKFSYVLKAMGLKDNIIDSALRFSLSAFTTAEEMDYAADVLIKEVPILRKIMR